MLKFDKVTSLSLLFNLVFSERLNISLCGSDVECVNTVPILRYTTIEFNILSYIFLVLFAPYREYTLLKKIVILVRIFLHPVRMRENADQKNSKNGHFHAVI